jgi:class 3 adenylate cyclase
VTRSERSPGLKSCRAIIDGLIATHRGRIFNTAGDNVVADFSSAVDAVECAVAVQAAIARENAGGNTDEPMQFRIGVHVGDVMVDGENLPAMGSTSRRGWKLSPSRVQSMYRLSFAIRLATGCR